MNWTPPPERSRRISGFLVGDVFLVLMGFALVHFSVAKTDDNAEGSIRECPVQECPEAAVAQAECPKVECPTPSSVDKECPAVECPVLKCSEPSTSECAAPAATSAKVEKKRALQAEITEHASRFEDALQKHIKKKQIEVIAGPDRITLRMPLKRAFQTKKPRFRKSYIKVMKIIRTLLTDSNKGIVISCHTDDQEPPGRHSSNWTYSSACAGHVARSVLRKGLIVSERIHVRAYANTRPLVPNTTKRGREKNRRLEIDLIFAP
jgi:flagellar motor protein MotB